MEVTWPAACEGAERVVCLIYSAEDLHVHHIGSLLGYDAKKTSTR